MMIRYYFNQLRMCHDPDYTSMKMLSDHQQQLRSVIFFLLGALIFVAVNHVIKSKVKQNAQLNKPHFASLNEWNEVKAKTMVLDLLQKHGNGPEYGYETDADEIMEHDVLSFYAVPFGENDKMIAIASSIPKGHNCHACLPALSVFEFEKTGEAWHIEKKYIDCIKLGNWGVPPSDIEILSIGYNTFGVVIKDGYSSNGKFEVTMSILTPIAGKMVEVFSVMVKNDDSAVDGVAHNSWTSQVNFSREGRIFYDIFLHQAGVRDDKQFEVDSLYKFDGVKYSTEEL